MTVHISFFILSVCPSVSNKRSFEAWQNFYSSFKNRSEYIESNSNSISIFNEFHKLDQKSSNLDQKSCDWSQKSCDWNQNSLDWGQKSSDFNQKGSNFNQKSSDLDQKSSNRSQKSWDLNPNKSKFEFQNLKSEMKTEDRFQESNSFTNTNEEKMRKKNDLFENVKMGNLKVYNQLSFLFDKHLLTLLAQISFKQILRRHFTKKHKERAEEREEEREREREGQEKSVMLRNKACKQFYDLCIYNEWISHEFENDIIIDDEDFSIAILNHIINESCSCIPKVKQEYVEKGKVVRVSMQVMRQHLSNGEKFWTKLKNLNPEHPQTYFPQIPLTIPFSSKERLLFSSLLDCIRVDNIVLPLNK